MGGKEGQESYEKEAWICGAIASERWFSGAELSLAVFPDALQQFFKRL